jgi:hypothetical protein
MFNNKKDTTPLPVSSNTISSHSNLVNNSNNNLNTDVPDCCHLRQLVRDARAPSPASVADYANGLRADAAVDVDSEDTEAWEDELEEQERGGVEVRSWEELRTQIKDDLAKGAKTLSLSRINQLLLIRNFATLRLKDRGRIEASLEIACQWHEGEGVHFARRVRALARHYQVFEQLPVEQRGGQENALSPLKDERLQLAARQWLTAQNVGQITPQRFRHALNNTILPSLNINLVKPLCEWTARRWLLKLGWQWTRLKKGVYMDGHERDDVKSYR